MAKETATQRMKRETRLTPEEEPEFQIAPMIDILLVLLVFFMSISSTEVLQINKDIILPAARDARDPGDNPDQTIINVLWVPFTEIGQIEVNERRFASPAQIVPAVAQEIARRPTMRVLLRADKNVKYDYMQEVMRALGNAGVANITFSVVDKEMEQQPQE